MTIPKFENETDEANWLYENREGLSAAFLKAAQNGKVRQGTLKHKAQIEELLLGALQEDDFVITPEELKGRTQVSVLREKLNTK